MTLGASSTLRDVVAVVRAAELEDVGREAAEEAVVVGDEGGVPERRGRFPGGVGRDGTPGAKIEPWHGSTSTRPPWTRSARSTASGG